jgi:hypothetical protein
VRAKLAALEETRETARRELEALEDSQARLEDLERDKGILLGRYAGMVPEALDNRTPEERHCVYTMRRLNVLAYPEGTLKVSGTLGDGKGLRTSGLTQTSSLHRPASSFPRPTRTRWPSSSNLRHSPRPLGR